MCDLFELILFTIFFWISSATCSFRRRLDMVLFLLSETCWGIFQHYFLFYIFCERGWLDIQEHYYASLEALNVILSCFLFLSLSVILPNERKNIKKEFPMVQKSCSIEVPFEFIIGIFSLFLAHWLWWWWTKSLLMNGLC